MGIFGGGQAGQPRYSGELHNLQLTESVFGTCLPIVIGTCRVHGKLGFYGGFNATSAPNSGKGVFGGKSQEYDYFADTLIFLAAASQQQAYLGLLNVWDQNGKLQNEGTAYAYTVPSGGGSVTPQSNPMISQDIGVYKTQSYSVVANDYGAGGSKTLTGTQNIRFARVASPAAATEYSFNPATGTYTFPAAAAGTAVVISFSCVFSLYYFVQTQAAEIPATAPYQISTDNQAFFWSDDGVTFVDTGAPLTLVSGTPTASGTYSQGSGFYTFAAADAGRYIYIKYTYTSSDPSLTNSSTLNLTFFNGAQSQNPWSYMVSKYPGSAFGYSAICYVGANPLALGESAAMPGYNYELMGLCLFGGGGLDAHPCDALRLILTDALLGVNFPAGNLDAWTDCYAYWASNNYFMSLSLDTQQSVSEALRRVIEVGNVGAVWSGGLLKLIPYGDTTTVGNGYTYTPPTMPAFTLNWDDILPASDHKTGEPTGDDPIQVSRRAPQDCLNYMQAQWTNRANDYNNELTPEQNDAFINTYGLRPEAPQTWEFITTQAAATWALNLRLKRSCYLPNTYKFALSFQFSALEPMDLVVLPTGEAVRVTKVDDAPDGRLSIEAEQWTYGSSDVTLYPKQAPNSFQPNLSQAVPGPAVPIFVQNTQTQSTGIENKVQIAASGQTPNWGGANVYASLDGITYSKIGTVKEPAVIGLLSANLGLSADPDTSDTLAVDITLATGANPAAELVSVTQQQADNFVSLCAIVDQDGQTNELIAYQTATLTAQRRYSLTYLRRGAYGTAIGAHTTGASFAFLGPGYTFVDYQYAPQYVGQSLFIKLQSFNLAGGQLEDLSQCKAWQLFVGTQGSNVEPPGSALPTANTPTTSGSGAVTNPAFAYDSNFSTSCSISANGALSVSNASCIFSGFASRVLPTPETLYTAYSGMTGTLLVAPVTIQYSTDGGSTWTVIAGKNGVFDSAANGTVAIALPAGLNQNQVQVRVGLSAQHGAHASSISIAEIWIQ